MCERLSALHRNEKLCELQLRSVHTFLHIIEGLKTKDNETNAKAAEFAPVSQS